MIGMDIIFLSEVKIQTRLGVPDWERLVPQTVILDIEIAMPSSEAHI
jgi:dihydroneopterin aldolase